uniref:DENN domain containing 1C n=1 Tax=Seriola dumerili TaxID=41447 RepID=A0A3B4TH35_SERDU
NLFPVRQNPERTFYCYLPWFEVFYKLLNNLADYLTKGQVSFHCLCGTVPYFIAPDPRSLPSIPENRNLTELIVAVDVGNLLQLYASMLFERRILIFASKLSTLTSCVHALSAVLYPMYWQHIFIPVLPPHLLDYCCAPMPYLIGVHTSLSEVNYLLKLFHYVSQFTKSMNLPRLSPQMDKYYNVSLRLSDRG